MKWNKHGILQAVQHRLQHVSDVAAVIHYWHSTNFEARNLLGGLPGGLDYEHLLRIQMKFADVLALRYCGYSLRFYDNGRLDTDTVHTLSSFVTHLCGHGADCTYDPIVFICLWEHRFPSDTVLARLHGMLSRWSRQNLLLLYQLLPETQDQGKLLPPCDNLIVALAQLSDNMAPVSLSAENIKSHVLPYVQRVVSEHLLWLRNRLQN